jgi:phage terminase large subunit-like protein
VKSIAVTRASDRRGEGVPRKTTRGAEDLGRFSGDISKTLKPFTVPHFKAWAKKLILDTGDPWTLDPFQESFLRDLFEGRPENWLIIPEGNGKTTLVAGLALYHCEFHPRADVPVAASSREQGGLIFRQAEGFILRSPYLHEKVRNSVQEAKGKLKVETPRFTPLEGWRRINHHLGGRIQVFAADDRTGDGVIPTLAIIDELHRHRDMRLYRTWTGKLPKRQGQIVTISTAGEPGSEFEQARERIRQQGEVTRKGGFVRAVAPNLVLHEWAVPEDGDVANIKLVKSANPLKAITTKMLAAKIAAPTMTMHHWRRFVCNLPTRADTAAIGEAEWQAAMVNDEIPEGVPIWVGLDLGWMYDTTAIVPLWKRDADYVLMGAATILIPPRNGQQLDPHLVEQALMEIHARNPIHTVVMDISYGANVLDAFIKENLGSDTVARGRTMPQQVEEYDRFMEGLRSGWLHHTGDEGLTAHAMNAVARVNRLGAAVFDRHNPQRTSGAAQDARVIDALDAAAMVHAQAMIPDTAVEAYAFYG